MIQRYQVGDQPKTGLEVQDVIFGGMGIVYILEMTRDRNFRRAMKSCDPEKLIADGGLERIRRESLLWISLPPHPNIVDAQIFEIDGGLPTLHMEYVAGGNLRDRLETGPLALPKVLRIASEFCEGMRFLTETQGIIHRDIKPENILFSDKGTVKITDFGLAGALQGPGAAPAPQPDAATEDRVIAGTVPYMAPEQFVSFEDVDTRADIYSFGVVLYEMLAGRLPFQEDSVRGMFLAHQRTPPPPLNQRVPAELKRIVFKCLEKRPFARFESFEALAAEIADFCRKNGYVESISKHHEVQELEDQLDAFDWNARGYSFVQLGDLSEALRCYRRGIERARNSEDNDNIVVTPGVDKTTRSSDAIQASLYHNMGAALMRMERLDEARQAFENALRVVPDDGVAHFRLGQLALHEGNIDRGLALLKRSTECEPGNSDLVLKYLRACYQFGAHDAFEESLREYLEAENIGIPALVGAGCLLDEEIGPEVALRCFDRALQSDPDHENAWYNRGVALHRMGYTDEALASYENAVRLNRSHPLARCYMGVILLRQDRREEAMWNLEQFLESASPSPLTQFVEMALQFAAMGLPLDSMLGMMEAPQAIKHIT